MMIVPHEMTLMHLHTAHCTAGTGDHKLSALQYLATARSVDCRDAQGQSLRRYALGGAKLEISAILAERREPPGLAYDLARRVAELEG